MNITNGIHNIRAIKTRGLTRKNGGGKETRTLNPSQETAFEAVA